MGPTPNLHTHIAPARQWPLYNVIPAMAAVTHTAVTYTSMQKDDGRFRAAASLSTAAPQRAAGPTACHSANADDGLAARLAIFVRHDPPHSTETHDGTTILTYVTVQ